MKESKASLHWAEQTLRGLSEQGFTGSMTVRLSQGGIQGIVVNQELNPRQPMAGASIIHNQ